MLVDLAIRQMLSELLGTLRPLIPVSPGFAHEPEDFFSPQLFSCPSFNYSAESAAGADFTVRPCMRCVIRGVSSATVV